MKVPAHFPKWDSAVDGLEDAFKWAMGIERSRLPPDVASLRQGQVWETIRDCEVSFRALFSRPPTAHTAGLSMPFVFPALADLRFFMDFGTAKLQRGERVRILDCGPKPIQVNFRPLRYDELHENIVPEEIRRTPGYSGYTLGLKTARTISDSCITGNRGQTFFNEVFHLVEDVA